MPKNGKDQSSASSGKKQSKPAPANTNAHGYVPGTVPSLPFLGSIGNSAALQLMGQTGLQDSDMDEDEPEEKLDEELDEENLADNEMDDEDLEDESLVEDDMDDEDMMWESEFAEKQYEEYLEKKENGEVQETLDYDSSDNDSEMYEDTFVQSLAQIYSVTEPYL
ncbi:hypothetical protein [Cohnella sp.]|uniref:hypothetical protein n=1 Tax=Cohnella sp. TaxID=1883426 RepID=UPI0035656CD0